MKPKNTVIFSVRVPVETEIELPLIPRGFTDILLRDVVYGIETFGDDILQKIGERWTQALIETAQRRRAEINK